MSANRYIELDSTYRNRNLYPEPADFVVQIGATKSQHTCPDDPISKASPILSWNSSFREDTAATSITITGITTSNSTSAINTFVITAGSGQLRTIEDYYVGAVLSIEIATVVCRRRITSYQYINATNAEITVDSAIPNGAVTASGSIQNPTGATDTDVVPKLFLPASDAIDNFYANYYVQLINNTGTGQSIKITYFDGNTHLATLASNTSVTWLNSNLNFVIRRELPSTTGQILAINSLAAIGTVTTAPLATATSIQLASTASADSKKYNNCFLRMIEPLPTAPFSTLVAPYSQERKIVNYLAGDGKFTAISAGTNTFTLQYETSSNADNYYVGGLITNSTTGDIRQITSYTGATHSGTVAVNWTAGAAGNIWTMRTAIIAPAFTVAPTVGANDTYELEYFTRDNSIPLNYIGSLAGSQEEVCYEVELINLILPNSVLSSGRGGRPVFYPYMYVLLNPVAGPNAHGPGIIYSNNPEAKKMLFRAVLDDTTQPVISPFIKIDSDGMVHVIKFKPNDAFHFAVYCPDGNLFKTVSSDTVGPTEPNPLVQISACFAFKKV